MAEYIYSMVRARKTVGEKLILDDVTMAFLPGAKIGMVGPNGAGKSTILKIMAGLDQPSNGEATLSPGYSVGILMQEPELDETTTVLDHYAPPVGVCGPMGRSTARSEGERRDLLARWRDDLADLAGSCPNVVAKHSGLAFPTRGHRERGLTRQQLAERVAPLVEHTTQVFGPDRLLFGSNYLMDKSVASYGVVVGALADLLADGGPDLLRKVFRDNARAVSRL